MVLSFPVWGTWQLSGTVQVRVHSFPVCGLWLLPGTIQGTALPISCLFTFSTNDPRHGTLHFLFMTHYFFHEWSKARHSPFPIYDPLLFPWMIQGTAFSISWFDSFLFPRTIQGTAFSFPVYYPRKVKGTAFDDTWLYTSWDDNQWIVQKKGRGSQVQMISPILMVNHTYSFHIPVRVSKITFLTGCARAYPAKQVLSFSVWVGTLGIADRFCNQIKKKKRFLVRGLLKAIHEKMEGKILHVV